uniref:Putative sodium-coupled neutral amino acid transporter 6 n=1 Tax=Lygus hesperus TaxID=30085 RepID=A0A0A9YA98_LYGHE
MPEALDVQPDISLLGDNTIYLDYIPFWKHLIVVFIMGTASLLLGLFIPNINTVFGFAGGISGGFLAFIFPALFHMYAGGFNVKKTGKFKYFTTYSLLLVGVVGVIFGTAGTIYSTAD